jgi:pimeloyl-ACP methyl ester carboxylesterase
MKRARLAPDEALPADSGVLPVSPPGRIVRGLHVRETPATSPDARPAVYVHGLGGSSQNWTDLADLLAGHLAGVAVDLPGFGRSEPVPRYSVSAFAILLSRWIEQSGRAPVHLLGNSLGGCIAIRVAASRPDLVRTLTLISPAMPFLDPRRSVQGRYVPLVFLPWAHRLAARRLATIDPAELVRMVIGACFADPGRFPEQRMAEAVEEARLRYTVPSYMTAYVRSFRGLISSFLRAYLPGAGSMWRLAAQVRAPTLVIGGRQDQLVDIRVAPQVARTIPDSRLLILDGVGHVAQMEVPRRVARAVLALLDEAEAASTPVASGPEGAEIAPGAWQAKAR